MPNTPEHILIGDEASSLLIFDDAYPDADELRNQADLTFFIRGGEVYPGVRAVVPEAYLTWLTNQVLPHIETVFAGKANCGFDNCTFSMVTTQPSQLGIHQSLPHTDENDPFYLAFIHYICDEGFGGTDFFRHVPTGYERITPDRANRYNARMVDTIRARRAAKNASGYFIPDDKLFTRIYSAENKFNRLVVYSGANLHTGHIPDASLLNQDPAHGRLTITGFLKLTPSVSTPETSDTLGPIHA